MSEACVRFRVGGCLVAMLGFAAAGCAAPTVTAPQAPIVAAIEAPLPPPPEPVAGQMAIVLPNAARDVVFAFSAALDDPTAQQASDTIRSHLERAGYRLVARDARGQDAKLVVSVRTTRADAELDGVAGSPELQVSLSLVRGADTLEALVVPVSTTNSGADMTALGGLVDALTLSPRLQALVETLATTAGLRATTSGPSSRFQEDERSLDEGSWSRAALRRCRNDRSTEACAKLEAYLERFPQGVHAAEARAALQLAKR